MTLSPVGADLLAKELGNDARGIGISQVMPYPFNDTTPVVREYQRLLKSLDKTSYSYYGIEAYDTAKVMVEAIRKAGKEPTREKLVQALEGMGQTDIGGYRINFAPGQRGGSKYVDLTVIGSGGRVLR
jgi:ABC-type branched-subunit amino acid transport system substrate-binding protein